MHKLQKKWVDYESDVSDSAADELFPTPKIYVNTPRDKSDKKPRLTREVQRSREDSSSCDETTGSSSSSLILVK